MHARSSVGEHERSTNQFFYNMATTTWALKYVLFVIDYKVLTTHDEEKEKELTVIRILTRHNQLSNG